MNRGRAVLGSMIFFVVAPGAVAGYGPWYFTRWTFLPALWGIDEFRAVGATAIALGLTVLVESFARFALRGYGTPAPVLPTEKLVVSGLFRWVRNPMYLGVLSIILGQALLFGSVPTVLYGAVIWLVFTVFVRFYEEPTLRRQFGNEYDRYCENVPRWIPRLRPWNP